MRLVYIYHSGFALEADGFSILIDYFKDSDPDPAKGYVRSELLKRAGTLYILAKETSVMDRVMFPVDPRLGTDFMRGAQQFIDRIKTSVFVPMHFWERPAEVMAFGPYAESKGCRYIVLSVPGEGTDI